MSSVFASAAVTDALFWIAVVACAVAQVAILRSVLGAKLPERAGLPGGSAADLPAVRASSRPVELFWAVLPAVALVVVLALTWRALHPIAGTPSARPAAPPAAEV